MEKLEVRCCCRADLLLGWLPVPKTRGPVLIFPIFPILSGFTPSAGTIGPEIRNIELPVCSITLGGKTYPAIKADETPIETLRLIPGFVEAMA